MIFLRVAILAILLIGVEGITIAVLAQDSQSSQNSSPDDKESVIQMAQGQMAIGRFWHASGILRDFQEGKKTLDPDVVLYLAEADAGWENWDGVVKGLEGYVPPPHFESAYRVQWLLTRGREELGEWASAYDGYTVLMEGRNEGAVMSRAARAAFQMDYLEVVLEILNKLATVDSALASWTALEIAERADKREDIDLVIRLLPLIGTDLIATSYAWDLEAKSWLSYGDSSKALESYSRLRDQKLSPVQRAHVLNTIADLRMAMGDSMEARIAYLESFEDYPSGSTGAIAAWALLEAGTIDQELILSYAKVLQEEREYHQALVAYDEYALLVPDSVWISPEIQMARASLLWRTGRFEDSVLLFRQLVETDDEDFELVVLDQWRQARRRQGNSSAVQTIEGWIIERFPQSRQGTDIIASRGHSAYSRSSYESAKDYYRRIQDMGSSHASAGLSRMRLGQIYLQEKDHQKAAAVFKSYLKQFPNGRRWEEATYWLSRTLLELGSDQEAFAVMQGLRKRSPLSYYGALVFDLLGEPYDPEISTGPYVAPIMWLQLRLAVLDKFQLAGLELATEAMVGGLIDSVEGSVGGSLLLAESLIERGFTIEGINLGWKLLGDGMEMSRRLALILYPFPYKDIVYNEALEYGADPILLAAVIRQESAFTPAIRSPVGAIGLMQVMPTTGAEIAKNLGFIGFTTSSLETPEINLHLGTRYLLEMKDRYGEVGLPLVLSAYNAGPTRARRWRDSLDSKDALRFTERIPFEETRGYVKNVVRNIHIYKFLYESPGSGVN
tara:strand:+ start:10576 stop:12930 length:2355 start_codon:yes stop_codon:yes gene_type:complete